MKRVSKAAQEVKQLNLSGGITPKPDFIPEENLWLGAFSTVTHCFEVLRL